MLIMYLLLRLLLCFEIHEHRQPEFIEFQRTRLHFEAFCSYIVISNIINPHDLTSEMLSEE